MSKRKLLLADDSVTIQKVVNLTFADEGIEVIAVGDGDAAMENFVESVPDLVMVDVNMPGLDGYKICEIIKQDEGTKHIPVILLVGSFEPFNEEKARRVGADDYLTKPFQSIRQLVSKVAGLLDSAKSKTAFGGETDETVPYNVAPGDGEIVQTNQIGSLPVDETRKFTSAFSGEDSFQTSDNQPPINFSANSGDEHQIEENDPAKTQPLSAEDLRRTNSVHVNDSAEAVGQHLTKSLIISSAEKVKAPGGTFSAAELDDADLLELPFSDDDEFYDDFEDETIDEIKLTKQDEQVASNKQSEAENQYTVQEIQRKSSAEIPFHSGEQQQNDAPEMTTAAAENQMSANLPPELIDAIAAKVVEKLSDKVIREIAREVVPQMADLIIRKMARDKFDK